MNASHNVAARTTNPTPPEWPPRTLVEREQLRERAITQAHELRRQAIADFWRDTGAVLVGTIDHGRRATDRLAARLRQHNKQRGSAAESKAIEA